MDRAVKKHLFKIKFGKLYQVKNMEVLPLYINSNDNSPQYMVLKKAMEEKLLVVREVSEGGSVPQLQVINEADVPVLVLDGEELIGARQNRVLNTSILLKQKLGTFIPVSCTEQGRWSYKSRFFSMSNSYMPFDLRKKKNLAVLRSLKYSKQFDSDQSEIWDGIYYMTRTMGVHSSTGEMKQVFDEKKRDIDEYISNFECFPGQAGMLVFINGEVAGYDFVSRPEAYRELHDKLLRSYAMDAMLRQKEDSGEATMEKAHDFLKGIENCSEEKFESVGYGSDFRYEGESSIGSALVHESTVIHSVFHAVSDDDRVSRQRGPVTRRHS